MEKMENKNKSQTLPRPGSLQGDNQSKSGNSRPVSFYDNFRENVHTSERSRSNQRGNQDRREINFERDRSPTQAHCLNTTVPQNIAALNIAGRHTPTRNSLRHSRMIVMNRIGKVPKKSLPPVIRYHKLAKALVGLQTLLGSALCFLALWLLLWTPNLRQRDNPYWSGLPLLLSGIFGLILMFCCRKEYPGMRRGYCVYSTKVVSVFLSAIAGTACFIASTFAIIHLISLSTMTCAPAHALNATCICKLQPDRNETLLSIKSYHYIDLSCPEVDNILSILLIFSSATNGLAGILATWYVYLHWASRYTYTYSKIRTKDNFPIVFSNT